MGLLGRKFLVVALLAFGTGAHALDNPAQMNFDGVLLDTSNAPITAATSVKFQIYDPSAACLLYEETQSVTPDSSGAFSVKIGVAANRASAGVDGGLAWKTVFSNKGVLRATSSVNCTSGYTPATTDGRKLRVTVAGTVLTPDFSISSTPFATTADTLQGYQPTDFLSNLGGSVTGFLKMDSQNEIRFADSGNSNYVSLRAPPSLGGPVTFNLPGTLGSAGQVLTTDGAGTMSWSTPAGGGLQLSGGTMTGAIAMGGNNITATGHITMSAQTTINLGTYTSGQEATLIAGLTTLDKGKTWFNSTSNSMVYWDGATAQTVSAGATAITALTGDVVASGPGSAAATIQTNAVTTAKILNDAITSNKINSTGVAINRILMTDGTTGSTVTYSTCAMGEVLTWTATGWVCTTLGTAASVNYGTAANQLLQLDGTGRVPVANLPTNAVLNGGNSLGSGMVIGTNDNNSLVLQTNALNRMTLAANGNLGIGSTAPASALTVVAAGAPTDVASFTGNNAAGTGIKIFNTNSTTAYSNIQFWSGAAEQWELGGSSSDFYIYDNMAGQNRLVITTAGNMGIGTSSPTDLLTVAGPPGTSTGARVAITNPDSTVASDKAELRVTNYAGAVGSASSLSLYTSRGTLSVPTAVQSGDTLGSVTAAGYTGASFLPGARIDFRADQVWTGSTTGSSIAFSTAQNGFSTVTERMRIDNNGLVGIGTTFPNVSLDVGMKTDAMAIPRGTSAQRPSGPPGMVRFNTTVNDMEMYNGTVWKQMSPVSLQTITGGYSDSAVATSTTYYTYPNGHSQINGGTPSTTDYSARTRNLVAHSGKLKNLVVRMTQDPASTWVFSVMINGSPSGLTCSVTSGGLTCSDFINFPPVNVGDEIGMKIDTGVSGAAARAIWAFDLEYP